jgi:hypothetical protein
MFVKVGEQLVHTEDIIMRTGPSRAARLVESFYEVDIRDRLPELRVPTTVLHGELDALPASRLDTARQLASLIPGARIQVTRPDSQPPISRGRCHRGHAPPGRVARDRPPCRKDGPRTSSSRWISVWRP